MTGRPIAALLLVIGMGTLVLAAQGCARDDVWANACATSANQVAVESQVTLFRQHPEHPDITCFATAMEPTATRRKHPEGITGKNAVLCMWSETVPPPRDWMSAPKATLTIELGEIKNKAEPRICILNVQDDWGNQMPRNLLRR